MTGVQTCALPILFLVNHFSFRYFSEGIRNATWSNIYETILAPQIALNLLKEIFGLKLSKFKVTPKEAVTRLRFNHRFRLVRTQIVFLIFGLLSLARLLILYWNGEDISLYAVNIYWLIFNVYILTVTIIYAIERPIFRQTERFRLQLPVRITKDRVCITTQTVDCSEKGLSILFDQPSFFESNRSFLIQLKTDEYEASFNAKITRSFKLKDKYVSAFEIDVTDGPDYRAYLQILYDRIPPVTRTQRKSTIRQNIVKMVQGYRGQARVDTRLHHQFLINRELTILVNEQSALIDVIDFDFVHLTLKPRKPKPLDCFNLDLDPDFKPLFKYDSVESMRHFQSEHPVYYYRVQNLSAEQEIRLLNLLRPRTTEDYYLDNEQKLA